MAHHLVTFSIPERELGKADVEFKIKKDGKVIGKLQVSKGTVEWIPKDHTYGFIMGWKDFDEIMQSRGKKRQ